MTIKTAAKATTPTIPSRVAVAVPQKPEGTTKAWRKLLNSVNDGAASAYGFVGQWLDAGLAYEMPEGALVMVVDRFGPDRWTVALTTATPLGLEPINTWELKGRLGKRVVDFTRRRLPAGAEEMTAEPLEAKPNWFESYCRRCRGPVPAGGGRMASIGGTGVIHHPGQCPPPPEIVRPNRWGGTCLHCQGWVAAETGAAVRLPAPRTVDGARYQTVHDPACPENPIPGPANRDDAWCGECGELVPAGEGFYDLTRKRARHIECPAERMQEPTWVARLPRSAPDDIEAGTVLRVQIQVAVGDSEVPMDAPGYRMLEAETGYCEMVAVVLELAVTGIDTRRVRVRAATPSEAEDVLAREVTLAPDVRPHTEGFKARFTVDQDGPFTPWLAEITGRTPQFGFQRRFLRADRDYSGANRKGTRGIEHSWTLSVNRVYEAEYSTSWTKTRRVFLRADPAGDVVEIDREEVLAWLDHAAAWIGS